MPKSRTLTRPSGVILMLAGFKSRWMTPRSCAASSACAICLMIGSSSLERHRAARDPLRQGFARNELHLDDARSSRLLEPEQRGDVGVIERSEHTRFALEAREPVGVGRERVVQHLEGDLAPEPHILGSKHLSHAARAKHVEQTVPPTVVPGTIVTGCGPRPNYTSPGRWKAYAHLLDPAGERHSDLLRVMTAMPRGHLRPHLSGSIHR